MPMTRLPQIVVHSMRVASALVLGAWLGADCLVTRGLASDPVDVIAGVSARAQAIASGRITYAFQWRAFRDGISQDPKTYPETTVAFSGADWAERTLHNRSTRINYDGYLLEFVETRQPDDSLRPGATLLPQKSLETRGELNTPPLFAGSFWHGEQRRYVEKHASRCVLAGRAVTNGVAVVIVELSVPMEDHHKAFAVASPLLQSGGILRLHVAEELGFVLPKVEILSPDRQLAQLYECADFEEACPGIYLPRRLWSENRRQDGSPSYKAQFTLKADLINQPIPVSEFRVDLPPGTRVQDAREPGSVVAFRLTSPADSLSLSRHGAPDTTGGLFGRWQNSIVLGFVVGSIASVSLLFAARNQQQRR